MQKGMKTMLNVKVTRLQPVVSQNANKLRAIADIEIGNGLMIYGLLYKLNKDNEFYVQMPQHMGRDGDYHSTVEPLSKEFAARIKAEIEKPISRVRITRPQARKVSRSDLLSA